MAFFFNQGPSKLPNYCTRKIYDQAQTDYNNQTPRFKKTANWEIMKGLKMSLNSGPGRYISQLSNRNEFPVLKHGLMRVEPLGEERDWPHNVTLFNHHPPIE